MRDWNSITYDRYISNNKLPIPVGLGILDISRDIDSEFIRKRTFDMTFWMINQSLKNGFGIYRGFHDTVESILETSAEAGDSICIIQCQGMMSIRLSHIVTSSIEYFKTNPERFVLGHIMDRQGRYPGLHRQMLIVNINTWKKLEKPKYLERGVFWDRTPTYKNYKVSESKIYAEYTPDWIEPAQGEITVSDVEDGANWVNISLRNNLPIDNLNIEMRECKCFLYPYEDTQLLEKIWNNLQLENEVDKLKNYSTKAWIRKMAYQEYIEKNRVYVFNTERLSADGIRSNAPIDAIFSAAAGFKPLALLRNNQFHENTVVHYFDWCEASLMFKKHLLETWDGIDLHKWLLENDLKYNFSSTYRGNYEDFWNSEIENEFESAEKFKELWDRYRSLKHHYHVIDIVSKPEKLFDLINQESGNKLLWTTNIWASMQLHWIMEPEELERLWLKFESLVPEDLILYGQDYMARDMESRIRKGIRVTHPRYISNNRYVIEEKKIP